MSTSLSERERQHVASAWSFRHRVECDAARRFEQLARRLSALSAARPVIELAERASLDEQRHARLCAELSRAYGLEPITPGSEEPLRSLAPTKLSERQQVLYEVVAVSCVTETESMGVLTTLLADEMTEQVREVVHSLARDEVQHSRLGWAHLAWEAERGPVAFLGEWVPYMLEGSAGPELFGAVEAERESEALRAHGVLPHASKRSLFVQMLNDVVFPGLERFGISSEPSKRWLSEQLRKLA